jgi:uncharacterized protein YdgA (DUF945 family)
VALPVSKPSTNESTVADDSWRKSPTNYVCGQAKTSYLVAAAVAILCVGLIVGVPAYYGARAEKIYRDNVRQLGAVSSTFRLDSYQRGWFSSQARLSFSIDRLGKRRVALTQLIHHGPIGFYNGWTVAFPVAAVIDTQPPPGFSDTLDRFLGSAPLVITTIVRMDGALDTYISRAATHQTTFGITVTFDGLVAEIHLAQDSRRISGTLPRIVATGGFGEAEIASVSLRGDAHRDSIGLWPGQGTLGIGRVGYSVIGHSGHGSSSGLVQAVTISYVSSLDDGKILLRDGLSIGSLSGHTLNLGPASLAAEIKDVPAAPIVEFRRDAISIASPSMDRDTQERLLRRKMIDVFAAILKQSPVATLELRVASPSGTAEGHGQLEIAPAAADDPALNADNLGKDVLNRLAKKYVSFSAEFNAPAALLAQLASAEQLKNLELAGALVHDDDKYVSRAVYKDGEMLVNGRKLETMHPMPCPGASPAQTGCKRSASAPSTDKRRARSSADDSH